VRYEILIKRSIIASHVYFSTRRNEGRLEATSWKDFGSINCAEENSSFLGNDYPEDGGSKLRENIDSSIGYHVTKT
jgi:hypothetical protein